MKLQALGCPSCQQPFQVAETQAGEVVACPSCGQPIEIPADAFTQSVTSDQPQQVHTCRNCNGQFGVTPDMFGQTLGCPHCQEIVEIGLDGAENLAVPEPPEPPESNFELKNKKTRWKSSSKVKSSRVKSTKAKYRKKFGKIKPIEAGSESDGSPAKVQRQIEPKVSPEKNVSPPLASEEANRAKLDGGSDLIPPKKRRVAKTHSVNLSRSEVPAQENSGTNSIEVADTVTKDRFGPELEGLVRDIQASPDSEPAETSPVVAVLEKKEVRASIDHLLPPRFDVLDPSRLKMSREESEFKVLLPDGDGGTKQVDNRVVRVSHAGEKVSLIATSDKEKSRRRLIQNVVAILIGIVILAGAFWLLG